MMRQVADAVAGLLPGIPKDDARQHPFSPALSSTHQPTPVLLNDHNNSLILLPSCIVENRADT